MNSHLNSSKCSKARAYVLLWILLFAASAFLYIYTCQRGVSWQDSGMFQWRIYYADYMGGLGIALAHPLYIMIAHAFSNVPFIDNIYAINCFSAVSMALAVANVGLIAAFLTGRLFVGAGVAIMFSVLHTVWWLAAIAEVYALHAAVLTIEIMLLILFIQKPSLKAGCALFFFNGLNLAIHNMALLSLPVYLGVLLNYAIKRRTGWSSVLLCMCAYCAGALPFVVLIIKKLLEGNNLSSVLMSALLGDYALQVFNSSLRWDYAGVNAGIVSLNCVSALILFACVGLFVMHRYLNTVTLLSLVSITALELLFAARYPVPDQFTFFVPTLLMISLIAAFGLKLFMEKGAFFQKAAMGICILSIVVPPVLYGAAPNLLQYAGVEISRNRQRPFRNEMRYWLVPWKHNERSAEEFSRAALCQAAPDGIIISDGTAYYPLIVTQQLMQKYDSVTVSRSWASVTSCANERLNSIVSLIDKQSVYVVLPYLLDRIHGLSKQVHISRSKNQVLYCVTPLMP